MNAEQRQITLTETDDGHWRAQVEPDGLSGSGETIEEALDALGDARLAPIEEILDALDDEDIALFDLYEPVLNALGAFNDEEMGRILAALDEADRNEDDDRTTVEERTPEDIIETHETFIEERDAPEPSASSAKVGTEIGHRDPDVHRHRENVAHLLGTDENEDE